MIVLKTLNLSSLQKKLVVFAGTFLLLSIGTIGMEITKIDVRFAVMTADLLNHPFNLFATVNGVEYGDYLSFYLMPARLFSLNCRYLNQWTLSFATILLSSWTVMETYTIGNLLKKGAGKWAALLLLCSLETVSSFMSFGIDIPVMAAVITMIHSLCLKKSDLFDSVLFCALLIFCFLVRGPIGPVVFGMASAGMVLGSRQWEKSVRMAVYGLITVVLSGVLLYLAVLEQGGGILLDLMLNNQGASRMTNMEYLFYFTDGIASYSPTAPLAVLALYINRKQLKQNPWTALVCAILLPLLLLSIPGCKHLRYMLFALPPYALIAAAGLSESADPLMTKYIYPLLGLLDRYAVRLLGFAAGALIVTGLCLHAVPVYTWTTGAVCLAAVWLVPLWKEHSVRAAASVAVYTALFLVPFLNIFEESASFVQMIENQRKGSLFLFEPKVDHDDLKYVFNTSSERRKEIVYLYSNRRRSVDSCYGKMYPGVSFRYHNAGYFDVNAGDIFVFRKDSTDTFKKLMNWSGYHVGKIADGDLGHKRFSAWRITGTCSPDPESMKAYYAEVDRKKAERLAKKMAEKLKNKK